MENEMNVVVPEQQVLTAEVIAAEMGKPHGSLDLLNNRRPPDMDQFAENFANYLSDNEKVPDGEKNFSWKTMVRTWSYVGIREDENFQDVTWKRQLAASLINSYSTTKLPAQFKDIATVYMRDRAQLKKPAYWGSEENLGKYIGYLNEVNSSLGQLRAFLYGPSYTAKIDMEKATPEQKEQWRNTQKYHEEIIQMREGKLVSEILDDFQNAFTPLKSSSEISSVLFERQKPQE